MKLLFQKYKSNVWFWLFAGTIVILFFLLPALSLDAGMNGDENFQVKQAESVIDFYATFGKDTTAIAYSPDWNLPQYGQVVDNFAGFIGRVFNIDDIMTVRHIVNSLCGWLAILLAGLICFKLTGNWRASFLAALLLFLSPRFLGHSFNNIKDVSFAAFMLMGIFYMIVYFQAFPKVKKSTIAMLAISIGLATAVRIGGLLLIPYFGLFCLVYFIGNYHIKGIWKAPTSRLFLSMIVHGVIIVAGGYILAVLLWPYALVSPVAHVKETFLAMSSFGTAIRQLFEGALQWSDVLPWYYTPKYILISIPVAVIIGFLLYPFIGGWKKGSRFDTFIIYFAFIFPVFWIVFTNANVYGGWRHAMFAYPPMVVAAGLGFNALVDLIKNKYGKIAATALPFLLLIPPFVHIVRNHPYEYVYFNVLGGGMKNAYGNYEMDYYYHSTREATEWVLANAEKSGLETGKKIRVASWHSASVGYYLKKDTANFQNSFSRWYERSNNDWDYGIFVLTGMMPEQLKSTHFPPANTVHEIKVDGETICIILKRDDKSDLKGFQYKTKGVLDTAVYYLQEALEKDPYNEPAMMNLIEIYMQTGQPDNAKPYIDRAREFIPKYETSNFFLAHYYLSKGNDDEALKICYQIMDDNYKFRAAYHLACNIHLRRNDLRSAEKELVKLIDIDQLDDQGVRQLIEIYRAQGLNEAAGYKKLYRVIAKSLEKRGKKKEAKEYYDLAKQIRI